MIVRIFRARVRPGQQAAFEEKARALSVPLVRAQPGLLAFFPGRPLGDGDEFVMVTVWRDLDALRGFVGDDWRQAVVPLEEVPFLWETSVQHYAAYGDSSVGAPDE